MVGGIITGCSITLFVVLLFLDRKQHFGCRDNRTDEERAQDEADALAYATEEASITVTPVSVTVPAHIKKLKSSETENPARFKILPKGHRNRKDD